MFLLDAPYVSDFLKQTVEALNLPALDTPGAQRFTAGTAINRIDEIEFAARMALGNRIYANSENALANLLDCGCNEDLVRQIDICKDKALFRDTVADIHPNYTYKRITPEQMDSVDITDMPLPFVIKPARGFFSLGVHLVNTLEEWPEVVKAIHAEREVMNAEYPEEVVNAGEFMMEEGIDGDEYAIDVYYDENGEPVITNILHHHFMSADDVSDRLYYTSTAIIEQRLEPFTAYTTKIGKACGFRNFPIHLEVRVTEAGEILPIEANPLRFAGWCVADITHHAWGINPYACYFNNSRPDWPALLQDRKGCVCAMVIADVPPSVDRAAIKGFDYDGFSALFDNILELRKIDFTEYPVFAFAFADMDEAALESLKQVLVDDFERFVEVG